MPTEITSCKDALRLLAAYLDGELTAKTDVELERHLAVCRSCYSRAEFERLLRDQLRTLGSEPVRPELSTRIRTLIDRFTVSGAD